MARKKSPSSTKEYTYSYYIDRYGKVQKHPTGVSINDYESTFGQFNTQNPFKTSRYKAKTAITNVWRYGKPTDDVKTGALEISFATVQKADTIARATSIASSKFLNRIREQDFDLGVFLGEYRETCKYVRERAEPLVDAIKAFKNKDPKGVFDALGLSNRKRKRIRRKAKRAMNKEGVSNEAIQRDLEFKFAISPIVSDIDALRNVVIKSDPEWTIGASQAEHAIYKRVHDARGWNPITFDYNCFYKVRVVGTVKIRNFSIKTMSEFGATAPLSTFYQVLPLSFLYEMFVPIGNWSKQFSALDGLQLTECSLNIRGVERCAYTDMKLASWSGDSSWTARSEIDCKYRTRTINFQPKVRFPRYDDQVPFEAEKLFSLVEVITQLCRKK